MVNTRCIAPRVFPSAMNRTPAERLKEAREKRYDTAQAAAEAHGWVPSTYRSYENGTRGITPGKARQFGQAFGVSAGFLLGLSGGKSEDINQTIHVPLVAVAAAGAFRLDEGIDAEGILVPAVPSRDVPAAIQYSVAVEGPSVNKRIPDGAFAICAPFDRYPGGAKHGQLVHVIRERAGLREHTVKEFRYTERGVVLMPCSTDPRYQDELVLAAEEDDTTVRIQGVVIGMYQPL